MENTQVATKRKSIDKAAIVTILVTENPKRKNSRAHTRFALYKDGSTVGEYLAAGGRTGDLLHDIANKFIEVSAL
jgi:hypothetical protein